MPYSNITDLPDSVKSKLSAEAQRLFLEVFNNAYKEYNGDEGKAFATAWAAVNKKYGKSSMEAITDLDKELAAELQCREADLPKDAFAYSDDKGGHLPHHGMDGQVKCNCVRSAIQAMGGARTGKPMMGVPDHAKMHLQMHAKQCGIETEHSLEMDESGRTSVTLAFYQPASLNFTEEPNGDTVFHDVILMAEGIWQDNYSKMKIRYTASQLASMKIERRAVKVDHDIFSKLPITNEIGVVENERYLMSPTPRWVGDVRIFPTTNGRDTATLLKRRHINAISPELFINNPARGEDGITQGDSLTFMGAATVRQGACSLCKFNEGVETTANEGTGGNTPTIEALEAELKKAVQDKGSDVAALTAQLEELRKQKIGRLAAELEAATKKVAELEQTNAELFKKVAEQERAVQLRELQKQIDEVTKQPVIHTKVTAQTQYVARPVELEETSNIRDFE